MRDRVEAWVSTIGRIVGLSMIVADSLVWLFTKGWEPQIAYFGAVLYGLGDVIGGVIGSIFKQRKAVGE